MTPRRIPGWLAAVAVAASLVAAVAVFLALFDWNHLRGAAAREVTRATGRSFSIDGDLTVALSLKPRIVANDVVVGNAAWSREPVMARIKAIEFRIDLLELLAGRISLPELTLSQPHLLFEVNASGEPNWTFSGEGSSPQRAPAIDVFTIDEGSAAFRDARNDTAMAFELRTLAPDASAPRFGMELQGKGRYKGLPVTLHARGGPLLRLRDGGTPYPVTADA